MVEWLLTYDRKEIAHETGSFINLVVETKEAILEWLVNSKRFDRKDTANDTMERLVKELLMGSDIPPDDLNNLDQVKALRKIAKPLLLEEENAGRITTITKSKLVEDQLQEIFAHKALSIKLSEAGSRYHNTPLNPRKAGEKPEKKPPAKDDFETKLAAELLARSFFYDALQGFLKEQGFEVDVRAHAEQQVVARSSLVRNGTLIVPHFFQRSEIGSLEPFYLGSLFNVTLEDYKFSFGFGTQKEPAFEGDNRGNSRITYLPIIAVDWRVMEAVLASEKGISLLSGIRNINGSHDWIHNIAMAVYARTTEDGDRRLGVANDTAPLNKKGDLFKKFINKLAITHSAFTNNDKGTTDLEFFSFVLNFQVWQHVFKEQPDVKKAVLNNAVTYFDNLGILKKELQESHGEKFANDVTSYLAITYFSQLGLVVAIDDPDLSKPVSKDGRSVADAVAGIGLPSYTNTIEAIVTKVPSAKVQYFTGTPDCWVDFFGDMDSRRIRELASSYDGHIGKSTIPMFKTVSGLEALKTKTAMFTRIPFALVDTEITKGYPAAEIFYQLTAALKQAAGLEGNEDLAVAGKSFKDRTTAYQQVLSDPKRAERKERYKEDKKGYGQTDDPLIER